MYLGPHAAFIIAAYAVTAFVVVALVAWVILDNFAQRRILGIDRRVAAASHGRDVVAKLTELGISPV